jgi:hypothetical protein
LAASHDSYTPSCGRSAAVGPLLSGFVCSTPGSRLGQSLPLKLTPDPKRKSRDCFVAKSGDNAPEHFSEETRWRAWNESSRRFWLPMS